MHPAPSVIIFTTFSGLGFGLLFWLGLGVIVPQYWGAFIWFTIAYLMAVGGLLASTFHLGHPERFLKAFSQWRSSWLSREGICAVATLIIMALYGAGLVFFGTRIAVLGVLGAMGALATVFTTAMIYTQMTTVPRWKHWTTPVLFLMLSLGGGALFAGQVKLAMILLVVAGAVQIFAWQTGDQRFSEAGSTLETATGLGNIGRVRAFEPPHTGTNYLLKEFVYDVGRRHVQKLRFIALSLGFVVPILALALVQITPYTHIFALFAVLSHVIGILALRWLFFAQAEHVVGLYYGKR
jgi:DMSO reductase anchor subunit